jgi:hypothetical protein
MRPAASGAPAAVKRRAVDTVHTVKILPVYILRKYCLNIDSCEHGDSKQFWSYLNIDS